MKSYQDRLREAPVEILKNIIEQQKKEIYRAQASFEMLQRDLELMERILREKVSGTP